LPWRWPFQKLAEAAFEPSAADDADSAVAAADTAAAAAMDAAAAAPATCDTMTSWHDLEQQQQQQVSSPQVSPQQVSPQQGVSLVTPHASRQLSSSSSTGLSGEPYNLRVVCHSLGGLVMLIHCIQR
jgi:hypothetical protein